MGGCVTAFFDLRYRQHCCGACLPKTFFTAARSADVNASKLGVGLLDAFCAHCRSLVETGRPTGLRLVEVISSRSLRVDTKGSFFKLIDDDTETDAYCTVSNAAEPLAACANGR